MVVPNYVAETKDMGTIPSNYSKTVPWPVVAAALRDQQPVNLVGGFSNVL